MRVEYASTFQITWALDSNGDQYAQVDVPENTDRGNPALQFIFTKCADTGPVATAHPNAQIFTVPVAGLSMSESPQVGLLAELEAATFLRSYADHYYISSPAVLQHIADNNVPEHKDDVAGYGADYGELANVAGIDAHVIGAFNWNSATTALTAYNQQSKMLIVDEVSETTPLGRAEWIHVIGLLTGKDSLAVSKFTEIRERYKLSVMEAAAAADRPTVWWGSWFGTTWYPVKNESYVAAFLRDANGEPLVQATNPSRDDALPLAKPAQFWLAQSKSWATAADAIAADAGVSDFASIINGNVWDNDKSVQFPFGPNDFFESAVVRPDQVLSELTRILHPEIQSTRPFKYFRKVADMSPPPSPTATTSGSSSSDDGEKSKDEAEDTAAPTPEPGIATLSGVSLGLTIGIVVLGALLISILVGLFLMRSRVRLVKTDPVEITAA